MAAIEEVKVPDLKVKTVEGMQFDRIDLPVALLCDQCRKMEAELDNPYILIYDKKYLR